MVSGGPSSLSPLPSPFQHNAAAMGKKAETLEMATAMLLWVSYLPHIAGCHLHPTQALNDLRQWCPELVQHSGQKGWQSGL